MSTAAADIARRNGVKKVTKSKSMVSEEVNLNERMEEAGIQVIDGFWMGLSKRSLQLLTMLLHERLRLVLDDLARERDGARVLAVLDQIDAAGIDDLATGQRVADALDQRHRLRRRAVVVADERHDLVGVRPDGAVHLRQRRPDRRIAKI